MVVRGEEERINTREYARKSCRARLRGECVRESARSRFVIYYGKARSNLCVVRTALFFWGVYVNVHKERANREMLLLLLNSRVSRLIYCVGHFEYGIMCIYRQNFRCYISCVI